MRRLFWLGVGVAVGALVVRRVTKAAEAYTPKGLANAVSNLGDSIREFAADVRVAMTEREDELLDALGVPAPSDAEEYPQTPGRHGR